MKASHRARTLRRTSGGRGDAGGRTGKTAPGAHVRRARATIARLLRATRCAAGRRRPGAGNLSAPAACA
ncbi:hypothetical protein G6F59_018707 [Rhizopus arrhizus]|nr:hypothetical protein G6F59_018707 [Rhizopus arrhizus]